MTGKLWWGKHLAGPIVGIISIASAIASAIWWNDPHLLARIAKGSACATGLATIYLLFVAQYDAWFVTDEELEKEKLKNEIDPAINITLVEAIPHGTAGSGMTDLFVHLDLELKKPSCVSIWRYSLTIENNAAPDLTFLAIDDLPQWELVKKHGNGQYSLCCVPLVNELTERGDPTRGWIHFHFSDVAESFVLRSVLLIKIKCAYGTCWYRFQGIRARPDRDTKGAMRKIST